MFKLSQLQAVWRIQKKLIEPGYTFEQFEKDVARELGPVVNDTGEECGPSPKLDWKGMDRKVRGENFKSELAKLLTKYGYDAENENADPRDLAEYLCSGIKHYRQSKNVRDIIATIFEDLSK